MLGWRPHTRVCGWRHTKRKAISLHVPQLGETGSSLKPARCDDTTSNHANHFLLGFRAHALNSHIEQTAIKQSARNGQAPRDRPTGIGQLRGLGTLLAGPILGDGELLKPRTDLWLAGGEAEPLTAQVGLYSTTLHRLHPLFGQCGRKGCPASSVSGHPVMGGNGPRGPGGNFGFRLLGLGFRVEGFFPT